MRMALKSISWWMACFRAAACLLGYGVLTWWETGTRNENVSCLSFGRECNVQSMPRDDGNTVFYMDIYIYMPLYDSDEDAI